MLRERDASADTASASLPPSARVVRDFVNTYEPELDRELLTSAGDAAGWLADNGLLGPDDDLDGDDLAVLLDVREGLRDLLRANNGEQIEEATVGRLDTVLTHVPLRVVFDTTARPTLAALSPRGADRVVAALLDAVYGCVSDGTWSRLKACARHSCQWAFYDASRNRSGRWCSMNGCGNQVKMRRAYAARKARAADHVGP